MTKKVNTFIQWFRHRYGVHPLARMIEKGMRESPVKWRDLTTYNPLLGYERSSLRIGIEDGLGYIKYDHEYLHINKRSARAISRAIKAHREYERLESVARTRAVQKAAEVRAWQTIMGVEGEETLQG